MEKQEKKEKTVILDIDEEKQELSNYCYASVLQAVVKHYNKQKPQNFKDDKTVSQDDICRFYQEGKDPVNEIQDPIDYLEQRGMINGGKNELNGVNIPDDVVVNEINAGRPIIVFVDRGHYVLLYGYEGIINNRTKGLKSGTYYFYDPMDPRTGSTEKNKASAFESQFLTNYKEETVKMAEQDIKNPKKAPIEKKKKLPVEINGYYLTKAPTVSHDAALAKYIEIKNKERAEQKKSTSTGGKRTKKKNLRRKTKKNYRKRNTKKAHLNKK